MQRIGRKKQREVPKGPKFNNLDDCQHALKRVIPVRQELAPDADFQYNITAIPLETLFGRILTQLRLRPL